MICRVDGPSIVHNHEIPATYGTYRGLTGACQVHNSPVLVHEPGRRGQWISGPIYAKHSSRLSLLLGLWNLGIGRPYFGVSTFVFDDHFIAVGEFERAKGSSYGVMLVGCYCVMRQVMTYELWAHVQHDKLHKSNKPRWCLLFLI